MKLLQKTSRAYLWIYPIVFIIAGFIFYFILSGLINEDLNEKLSANKTRIIKQLSRSQEMPSFPPLIQIEIIPFQPKHYEELKDTSIYDPNEGETESFRQLTSIETINGTTYRIIVRSTLLEVQDLLLALGLSSGVLLILLFALLFYVNRRIARQIWKPFYQDLEMMKFFSLEGDQELQFEKSNISEFQELNLVLEKLSAKARSDYQSLKKFTENASHEIQTPLAILQSKLDLMAQRAQSDPELARQLESAQGAIRRLSRLNQGLLLLTRIENHQFTGNRLLDMSNLIREELSEMEDFIQNKNIQLFRDLQPLKINADPVLAGILVSNLLSNAIRHNIENGLIRIVTSEYKLIISNTGPGLGIEPEELFKRFTKADTSSESLGLGLSIVKKICDVYGWEINYTMDQDMHQIELNF